MRTRRTTGRSRSVHLETIVTARTVVRFYGDSVEFTLIQVDAPTARGLFFHGRSARRN